jgi:hypothetical protein
MKKIHYTFFTLFILLGTTCWIQFSKFESEIKSKINASIVDSIQKDLYIRVNSPQVNKRKVDPNHQSYYKMVYTSKQKKQIQLSI